MWVDKQIPSQWEGNSVSCTSVYSHAGYITAKMQSWKSNVHLFDPYRRTLLHLWMKPLLYKHSFPKLHFHVWWARTLLPRADQMKLAPTTLMQSFLKCQGSSRTDVSYLIPESRCCDREGPLFLHMVAAVGQLVPIEENTCSVLPLHPKQIPSLYLQ